MLMLLTTLVQLMSASSIYKLVSCKEDVDKLSKSSLRKARLSGVIGDAPLGTVLMLGASMSWALGTLCTKRWPVDLPASSFTAWQLLLSVVPFGVGSILLEPGGMSLSGLGVWPIMGVIYNVLVSFMFCMWAWTRIVVIVPATVSSLSPLLIPVVGVFSGMVMLGEKPQWTDFGGLLLVSMALATVVIPPRQRA